MLDNFKELILAIVAVGVVLAIGFVVMAEGSKQINNIENASSPQGGIGWNASRVVVSSMDDIPGWLPIIIVASIGVGLIGLVKLFRVG